MLVVGAHKHSNTEDCDIFYINPLISIVESHKVKMVRAMTGELKTLLDQSSLQNSLGGTKSLDDHTNCS